ncbi:MAG: hypothetical protein V3T72_19670, partial [Thermoanaerobaculia bacterium]
MAPAADAVHETGIARSRPIFGTGLLLASAAALLLPATAAAAAIAALSVLWWTARLQPGRWLVGIGLGLTALLLSAAVVIERWPEPELGEGIATLEQGYARLWEDIAAAAQDAAAAFPEPPRQGMPEPPVFELFQRQVADHGAAGLTLFLIDPDGTVLAWAGDGLRNKPANYDLPRSGRIYRQGYTAATLLAVEPLTEGRRPWRLVAGRSFATDRLPFSTAGTSWPAASRWSLGEALATPSAGGWRLVYEDAPAMFVRPPEGADKRWTKTVRRLRRAGLVILGFTLVAMPILRAAGLSAAGSLPALLMTAGFAAWGAAVRLPMPVAAVMIATVGLVTWAFLRPRVSSVREGGGELAGAAAAIALAAAAWWFQSYFGSVDLAAKLGGSPTDFALRLTVACLGLGLLRLCGRRLGPSPGDRSAWLAAVMLCAAAAFHDLLLVALPLAAAGAGLTVRWLGGVDFRRRPAALTGLLVLAVVLGSVCWETAYREVLRSELEHDVLPKLAPPTPAEANDLLIELFDHLQGRDLAAILEQPGARAPGGGGSSAVAGGDLACRLWLESPLSARDGLSALVVEPLRGRPSTFTFGLSLEDDLELARDHARWQVPPVAVWHDSMIFGESQLTSSGRPWGRARYWFLPRPGFRLEVSELDELDAALVRGELHKKATDGLPATVLYGLYSPDGEAIVSPWQQQPALPPPVLAAESSRGRTAIPAGRAWFWAREDVDGIEVLYLPALVPLEGLERMGVHALGSLALIAFIG